MHVAYSLKDNKIVKLSDEEVEGSREDITWIRCMNPSEEEIIWLSKITGAPESEFQETMEEEERPKVKTGRYMEVIYSVPHHKEDQIMTFPLYFYLTRHTLLTIEKKEAASMKDLARLLKKNKAKFLFKGTLGHFLYYIIDKIHDEYLHLIERLSRRVDFLEDKGEFTMQDIDEVYDGSVTLAYVNQSMLANIEVLNSIRKIYYLDFSDVDREMFAELYHDALQLRDTERVQREVITNLLDLQALISTKKLNALMKRLTSLALIIMVPTLITGVYGMNVTTLPFATHAWGFWIISTVMIVVTTLLLLFFFHMDWI